MIRWIKCNILNKHAWGWCGYRDLYGVKYYHCGWCNRIKQMDYQDIADKKREKFQKELYSNFGKSKDSK